MKPSVVRRPMQVASYFRKEVVEVVRQPRLLLTLVIGPFLIMAVFGIGYRDTTQKMRTLFVVPKGSPLVHQVDTYARQLSEFVSYRGLTSDRALARRRLAH